jgi:hypothetical protein
MTPTWDQTFLSDGRLDYVRSDERDEAASEPGASLFQNEFFFCTVAKFGDLPATGCIHVEIVADRESGVAFAKVYPEVNAFNAADILASRVLPFFERRATTVKEIHTPRKGQYSGLLSIHPYETFLAASHIKHLSMEERDHTYHYFCEQFYGFLLKEFFRPALRKKFQFSLQELQRDLDVFVETYNALQWKRANSSSSEASSPPNFSVDV